MRGSGTSRQSLKGIKIINDKHRFQGNYSDFFLSLYHSIVGEIIFFGLYYNVSSLGNNLDIMSVILVVLYSVPIILLYKSKQLLYLLLILVFTPICTILSIFAAGILFPLGEEDLGAGLLILFVIGFNYLFVFWELA